MNKLDATLNTPLPDSRLSLPACVNEIGGHDQVAQLQAQLMSKPPLALLGAGNIGRKCLAALRQLGLEPVCFADDTPGLPGRTLDDVPILSPGDAAQKMGGKGLFICSFYTPSASLQAACERLHRDHNIRSLPFLPLVRLVPSAFTGWHFIADTRAAVESSFPKLEWLWSRLSDQKSRMNLAAQQAFRLTLDCSVLPDPEPPLSELQNCNLPFDDLTFIDCGAFDGDTVAAFLKLTGNHFKRIIAFEPDRINFSKLEYRVSTLPAELQGRISCLWQGVWSTDRSLRFEQTGTPGSAFGDQGEVEIEAVSLDSQIRNGGGPVFLKLDVEGAELEALQGAAKLLSQTNVLACVSVYHEPDHLWQVPELIDRLASGRRMALRSHGHNGTDLVIYSFPNSDGAANVQQ